MGGPDVDGTRNPGAPKTPFLKTAFIALRAVTYGAGFVYFWGRAALAVRRNDIRFGFELPPGVRALGVLLMIPGGFLVLLCLWAFVVRGRGTGAPFDPPRVFVAAGPYRWVRNPMYVGGAAFLLGFGLFERSISILIFALLSVIAVHVFVLAYEEPNLERRFGASYLAYKAAVHRWIPRRPPPLVID